MYIHHPRTRDCSDPSPRRRDLLRLSGAAVLAVGHEFLGVFSHPLSESLSRSALAQTQNPNRFPNKPIQLVMGFPPGGSGDFVGRLIGEEMGKILGQNFLPLNKPGAATNIASEFVARSAPDGYTLLLGGSFSHSVNPALFARLPYDPLNSFTPIGKVASLPTVLAVAANLPTYRWRIFQQSRQSEYDPCAL
jgi:tripartite-type tricarboxylate transporter receptor subunit TctC